MGRGRLCWYSSAQFGMPSGCSLEAGGMATGPSGPVLPELRGHGGRLWQRRHQTARFSPLCHQTLAVTSSPENAHHATGERGWKQEEMCLLASSDVVAPSQHCLATALPGWEKRAADARALHQFLLPWQACPAVGVLQGNTGATPSASLNPSEDGAPGS